MAWGYRKPITINSALVPGALTDFPILVSLVADSDLSANAKANGDDIAFFDSDETTKLDHDLESYSSGTLIAHVRKPSLPATGDPKIYMYYGDAALGPQQNRNPTWNAVYHGVWHLGEDPSGTPPQHTDSTGNGHNATATSLDSGNSVSAQIGNGVLFNGADDRIVVPHHVNFRFAGGRTVTAWIRADAPSGTQHVAGTGDASPTAGWKFKLRSDSKMEFNYERATDTRRFLNNNALTTSAWTHVAASFNSTTPDTLGTVYVDGVDNTGSSELGSGAVIENDNGVFIGVSQSLAQEFSGVIDELRISINTLSANWITTEYNNQSNIGSFLTIGAEESLLAFSSFLFFHCH